MKFYDLSKPERDKLVEKINSSITNDIKNNERHNITLYYSNDDTYIRKSAYISVSRLYFSKRELRAAILSLLKEFLNATHELIRQTTVNTAGEIGKFYFNDVQYFFDKGLLDENHKVRNAVIGSLKKASEKNPGPTLHWVKQYLHDPNEEIRRQICHGIELRGRKYPQDVLPLLKVLQYDKTARVKNTLVHVIGQISYKKGCLETVISHLKTWQNKELVQKALAEIIDVHKRYESFAVLTQKEVIKYINKNYP